MTRLDTQARIQFAQLSSGEQVLVALALSIYNFNSYRDRLQVPKLLLLDEVDAILHPSMIKQYLRIVEKIFVKELQMHVIATTHSPTTVALAPDDAIHLMNLPGDEARPRLEKVTKQFALNALTIGVPTLSIECSGRRQVLVESPLDVELYSSIFQQLRSKLENERSLEFISTGTKDPSTGTDRNTGVDNVARLVGEMSKSGNLTIFGLVDWDGHRRSSKRIRVCCEGERYTFENSIFDPLVVALMIARDGSSSEKTTRLGLQPDETYTTLHSIEPARLQLLADKVVDGVLGRIENDETKEVAYVGGLRLSIAKRWLEMNGHSLEEQIVVSFPSLSKFKNSNPLKKHAVEVVFNEHRQFIPESLRETFASILSADID